MDDFAPYLKENGCFIVRNVTPDRNKTIRIFTYPILFNTTRDLLQIPGVSEADIRASLLKGELKNRILANDIVIECSDIDLLQFNSAHKTFLQSAGIVNGLQVSYSNLDAIHKEDVILSGTVDGVNNIFTIPTGKFIQNSTYKIIVYLNGVKQLYIDDYIVAESGGVGTGYDKIILTNIPDAIPLPADVITADYYILNT